MKAGPCLDVAVTGGTGVAGGSGSLLLPSPWYSSSVMLMGPTEALSVSLSVHLCSCGASALCTGCGPLTACPVCPPLHTSHCSSRPQAIFTVLLGPFTFFDVQKTKYLQILTSLMRWIGESEKFTKCLPFLPGPSLHLCREARLTPSWDEAVPQFSQPAWFSDLSRGQGGAGAPPSPVTAGEI